jgi:mono/diheme cytochrome c family protein
MPGSACISRCGRLPSRCEQMRRLVLVLIGGVASMSVSVVALIGYVHVTGLESQSSPGVMETRLARIVRGFAVPADVRTRPNPVPRSVEGLADGMAHFADHCAGCHANDGSGNAEMGRGLYPKAPDMRLAATQTLTDGELFWFIEHGIRFTGMPAWSTGTLAGETSTWQLVHFIRHLPELTEAEREVMRGMNPRPPADVRFELEEERFLSQGEK